MSPPLARGRDPFRPALAAAVGIHVAMAILAVVARPERRTAGPAEPPSELFVVTEEPAPAPAIPVPEPPTTAPSPAGVTSPPGARSANAAPREAVVTAPEAASAAPASPFVPFDPLRATAPAASVNLGVDGLWKTVASNAPGAAGAVASDAPEDAVAANERIQSYLRNSLDEHDREMGLGRAGVLASAAHEAASSPSAPDEGAATYEVESDAAGRVTRVALVGAIADAQAWSEVGQELLAQLATKRFRVPPGHRGVRAHVQIVAKRSLPSGEGGSTLPGAVPDDVAGANAGQKACVGEGLTRKCAGGMPVGATGTMGDLSNIGQHRTRVVHARVVDETTF